MNKYDEKFAKLTAEQSKALAEAMNANYNRPPEDERDDKPNGAENRKAKDEQE